MLAAAYLPTRSMAVTMVAVNGSLEAKCPWAVAQALTRMGLSQKRKPLRSGFRRSMARGGSDAVAAASLAIASLGLTTVSLAAYLGSSALLTWILVGLALAAFTHSLVRYTQVVGRRTARVGVHAVWLLGTRPWRIFVVVCVAWGVAVVAIGDHVTLETPMVNHGHYVTTRYGHVARYVSSSEYRALKMGRFRLFGGVAALFASIAATIGVARKRLEVPDGASVTRHGAPCT